MMDEHEFPVEEQPLPPVVSPTTESPGYVIESDPEEDPEEYKDDVTEDGPVEYPIDGGEDGDDDKGDSSGDDADDEDEDEEDEDEEDDEEEEEEHLAPVDSAVVVSTVELVSPPEGIKPVIPPPSTDITTTRARITVRLQASISLPPEAEVERLLAMPTPPPSPPISLSPPSARERLTRCMAPPAHLSPPPVPSPLLPSSGCPTQIQTLRIASTQALVDAVTAALPSPPLPPLPPSLYIPPPVDHRDDIPEFERPPHKRSCLFALGSGMRPGRVLLLGLPKVDPAEAVPKIAPMTVGEVNTRVIELVELHEHDTQDLYALLEDAQDSRTHISQRAHAIGLGQAVHYELQTHRNQAEMAELQETDRRRQAQMVETLRVMRDNGREIGVMQPSCFTTRVRQDEGFGEMAWLALHVVTLYNNHGPCGVKRVLGLGNLSPSLLYECLQVILVSTTQKETPSLLQSTSSHSVSSNFGNQFITSPNASLIDTIPENAEAEINSLLDTKIQQDVPNIQFTELKRAVKELKQAGYSTHILASIRFQVPSVVKEYLGSSLFDAFQKYELKKKLYAKIHKSQSNMTHEMHQELFDALTWSMLLDEANMEKGDKPDIVLKKKDRGDNQDEDPSARSKQGKNTKRIRVNDSESSKKTSTTKESSKGKSLARTSKSCKSVTTKESVDEPVFEIALDDVEQTVDDKVGDAGQPPHIDADETQADAASKISKKDWFKDAPRPKTLDPDWNTIKIIDDTPE
ncbi:hypothetical protein Tco_1401543 [Tanacetum coccineum]